MNNNLNIQIMKKTLLVLLTFVALFVSGHVHAQFRSLPGQVTDSFKVRYPTATGVTWSDKVSAFQAVFMIDKEKYVARYSKDGEWLLVAQCRLRKQLRTFSLTRIEEIDSTGDFFEPSALTFAQYIKKFYEN